MEVEAIISATIAIRYRDLQKCGPAIWQTTKQLFTYKNPKFLENEKWGYSNHATPKFLYSYEIKDDFIYIARGGLEKLENHLNKFKIKLNLIDRTFVGPHIEFNQSNTTLRKEQEKWVTDLHSSEYGCGQAYTSFGKSLSALELISKIGQKTLILVHTDFLLEQWIAEATNPKTFNLSLSEIGGVGGKRFGGGKRKLGKINICLYQSLCKSRHLEFFEPHIGCLLFDEGQKTPIEGVQKIVNNFRARYKFSVSAGFKRKDGKEFLTFDGFGPIRTIAVEKDSKSKILANINLVPSKYEDPNYSLDGDYSTFLTRMAINKPRNIAIAKRAIEAHKNKRLGVIFVERKVQAAILAQMLSNFRVDMLLGSTDWKEYSLEHLREKYKKESIKKKRRVPIPKGKLLSAKAVGPKTLNLIKMYDHKTAYDRIKKLADKKKLDFVICSKKAEVGLSIRPLDYGIVTFPAGNNLERFNQILGRIERTYSDEQVEYFGEKKPTPILDLIVDYKIANSKRSGEAVKEMYSDRVNTNKKNVIRRKKGEKK